jgi:hypothetical protein
MKRKGFNIFLAVFACFALVLLSPMLVRKRTISLIANGHVVAVAKRSDLPTWKETEIAVYQGDSKKFSLWCDWFEGPFFIYPFPDGQRFLCDYDDDVAMLDFVVDLRFSATDVPPSPDWPTGMARTTILNRMTNIVMDTTAQVRLPSLEEVQEVRSNLAGLSGWQFRSRCIPFEDLGFYRTCTSKEFLFDDLSTNRSADWP